MRSENRRACGCGQAAEAGEAEAEAEAAEVGAGERLQAGHLRATFVRVTAGAAESVLRELPRVFCGRF